MLACKAPTAVRQLAQAQELCAFGRAPVDTITAGYWPVPLGTDTLSNGEAASRYGKSVVLAGSPYSLTHAWPARPHEHDSKCSQ